MSSQQKYLKYKSKYLDLKRLLGGTKEESNNFILHGTNLYYIDDIKNDGLTGKYNDTLYNIIKKYMPILEKEGLILDYLIDFRYVYNQQLLNVFIISIFNFYYLLL